MPPNGDGTEVESGESLGAGDGNAVELMFKRSVNELSAIVAATGRFFSEHAIDPAIRPSVDLAIEELFVNMVKYNRGGVRDIQLRLAWTGDALEACLTDFDVAPFDPTHAPVVDIDAPLDRRQPNGLGLYLVSKMVDSIRYEYRDRQSQVTFVKKKVGGHA